MSALLKVMVAQHEHTSSSNHPHCGDHWLPLIHYWCNHDTLMSWTTMFHDIGMEFKTLWHMVIEQLTSSLLIHIGFLGYIITVGESR
jgi:hypothetical protein